MGVPGEEHLASVVDHVVEYPQVGRMRHTDVQLPIPTTMTMTMTMIRRATAAARSGKSVVPEVRIVHAHKPQPLTHDVDHTAVIGQVHPAGAHEGIAQILPWQVRSEEHTSELQSRGQLV